VSVGGAEWLLARAASTPWRQDPVDEVANDVKVHAGRLGAMSVAVDGEQATVGQLPGQRDAASYEVAGSCVVLMINTGLAVGRSHGPV
jgi:hypothetical protein